MCAQESLQHTLVLCFEIRGHGNMPKYAAVQLQRSCKLYPGQQAVAREARRTVYRGECLTMILNSETSLCKVFLQQICSDLGLKGKRNLLITEGIPGKHWWQSN